MTIKRREVLKLSAGALMAVLVSPFLSAQTNQAPAAVGTNLSKVPSSAISGNISYNAGWVVPLEDKAPLLDLEAKKTKERDDLVKQKAASGNSTATSKESSKSLGKRFQETLAKFKSWF